MSSGVACRGTIAKSAEDSADFYIPTTNRRHMSERILEQTTPFSSEFEADTFEKFGEFITPEQICALRKVYGRLEERPTFHNWINSDKVRMAIGIDCIMVNTHGNFWLGIEKDGYTHS